MKRYIHRSVKPPLPDELDTQHHDSAIYDVNDLVEADKPSNFEPQLPEENSTNDSQQVVESVSRRESLLPVVPEEPEYTIDKIIKGRMKPNGIREFLIHWKGYPNSERTWEPYENLNEAAKQYVDAHKIPFVGKRT